MTNKDKLQEEAFKALKKNKFRGGIIAPTGSGKAKVLVEVLKAVKPKTCYYLCDSTKNRDETFRNEMIKWGAEEFLDVVEFYCYQTAYKFEGNKVDLLLSDESDYAMTDEYSKVFFNNKFKKIVLASATIADDKRKLMESIVPIVYEKHLEDIEGEGIVNETRYYLVKYMLNKDENFQYLKFNSKFAHEFSQLKPSAWRLDQINMQRNLFLSRLDSSLDTCKRLLKELYIDENRKILIFAGVSSQADAICKYSYHSNADNEQNFLDFDEGKIRILSVVGKIDRGANINGVNTVVFEAPYKSKTKQQQKSGRGRRLHVDDILEIYFLIPYFKDRHGHIKPTVVEKWVYESVGGIEFKPKIYHLKQR